MINVYVASVTGNTLSFAETFLKENTNLELNIVQDLSYPPEGNTIAIACSTWSNGKIPKKMKEWLIENHSCLKGKSILIFGSGYTLFQHYCRAVDSVNKICLDSGARTFLNLKFEQVWDEKSFSEIELEEIKNQIKNWEETYRG